MFTKLLNKNPKRTNNPVQGPERSSLKNFAHNNSPPHK